MRLEGDALLEAVRAGSLRRLPLEELAGLEYFVDRDGRVYSLNGEQPKVVSAKTGWGGLDWVTLMTRDGSKRFCVGELVAETFMPEGRPGSREEWAVVHLDGNPRNNAVSNLRWMDLGNYVLNASELGKLRDDFSEPNLSLWAVLTNSPKTELTAQSLGLATRISKPLPQEYPPKSPDSRLFDGENAVYIKRTLRSGFSVQHSGHIVVIGDVNPGAEIIAGGSIIVWGKLKGVVHAGANGDQNAIVCALDLSPTQLRIAEHIALAPQRRGKPMPEVARLVDGHVIADARKARRRTRWPSQ